MNDEELLRAYVREGSQDAFAELVRRHVGLVYATALRRVRGADSAQEVTQQVFCVLARKSGSLRNPRCLPSWLHQTSLQISALHVRSEQRRLQREHAAAMNLHESSSGETSETLEAWLDQALRDLDDSDRTALLLRYFESQPIARVGEALGISEAAAKMRIHRALEKLRSGFALHGIACSAVGLLAFLEQQARAAAPEALTAAVLTTTRGLAPETVSAGSGVLEFLRRWRIPAVAALVCCGLWVTSSKLNSPTPLTQDPVALAEQVPSAPATPEASDGPSGNTIAGATLRIEVLDAESQMPLAGVAVRAVEFVAGNPNHTAMTDSNGSVEFTRPIVRDDFYLRVTARLDGFVTQCSSWSRFQRDGLEDIPEVYVVRMSRGIRMGGQVQDSKGRPVPGASVSLRGNPHWTGAPPRDRAWLEERAQESVLTDAQGRWSYAGMPSDWSQTEIEVQAPEFLEARFVLDTSDRVPIGVERLSSAALLAETSVIRLAPGHVATGRVEDLQGTPISGARIVQNRAWGDPHRSMDSAEDGSFHFGNLPEGTQTLTVQAPGYAATKLEIAVPLSTNLVVRLPPGRELRGRVLNERGEPVSHAEVEWTSSPPKRPDYWLDLKTDADGRFSWNQAPGTEVPLTLYRFGFIRETVAVPTDGTEALIVLKSRPQSPPRRVFGRVLDAVTGAPVDEFRVHVGGLGDVVKRGKSGIFAFTSLEAEDSVEIRAPGYSPVRQDLPRSGSEECRLEFRLIAAEGWSGQVLRPNGSPASGVDVALVTSERRPTLGRRRFLDRTLANVVTTDADGGFAFDPEPAEMPFGRMLVAVSQEGYAEHDAHTFRPGQILTLQPWGRIEGTVRGRSSYPPTLRVSVLRRSWNPWMPVPLDPGDFSVRPDEQGRFVLECVPPGNYSVGLIPEGSGTIDRRLTFQVLPGKTTTLEVPDDGHRVSGRLFLGGLPLEFSFAGGTLVRQLTTPVDLPRLRRQDFASDEAFTKANQNDTPRLIGHWNSATGLSAWMEQRSYAVQVRSDGSWEARSVPPGLYTLKLAAHERPHGEFPGGKRQFLKSVQPIRIGAGKDVAGEPSVDLGPIDLEPGF